MSLSLPAKSNFNIFQLVKPVLDESYNQISGSDDRKKNLVIEELISLEQNYRKLRQGNGLNYRDPVTRVAYIYKYVTSHANLVSSVISSAKALGNAFDQPSVQVACIGGGPGSDFLGVLKFLTQTNKKPNVKFWLYDREPMWGESWGDIDSKVNTGFQLSTVYQPFDVTNSVTWETYTKYLNCDIFTMIYFMSEVYALRDKATPFFENLFSKAKPGALFLFVDNNNKDFYNWYDELAAKCGVKPLKNYEGIMKLPTQEEKKDLGEYLTKFGYAPKIEANVAYRVGQKALE